MGELKSTAANVSSGGSALPTYSIPLSARRQASRMERKMQQNASGPVSLVLGGVRSGKSRYAQQLAERTSDVVFIATGSPGDDEMRARIDRHRAERPAHWRTVEEPLDLGTTICTFAPSADLILVDCLTIFAATLLETCQGDSAQQEARIADLCSALVSSTCAVVLVSNEVGSGVVPPYPLGRQYRDLLGEINQRVASVATEVVLMIAGLPLALKPFAGTPGSAR